MAILLLLGHFRMSQSWLLIFLIMILSGMVNSVIMMRAHAELVPTLHHGSVWISLIAQVMILRFVFVMIKILIKR